MEEEFAGTTDGFDTIVGSELAEVGLSGRVAVAGSRMGLEIIEQDKQDKRRTVRIVEPPIAILYMTETQT